MTFDEQVKEDMNKLREFQSILERLNKTDVNSMSETKNKNVFFHIKSLIEIINWNLNGKEKKTASHSNNEEKHILISYDLDKREVCLKLKQKLEALEQKTWMNNMNEMNETSLAATVQAIGNSSCVLMCVTEKYRQSNFCQAVATYALSQNKRIIALIMQDGYENPSGWLGKIVETNEVSVNFAKYDFEECINQLKHILLSHLKLITLLSKTK